MDLQLPPDSIYRHYGSWFANLYWQCLVSDKRLYWAHNLLEMVRSNGGSLLCSRQTTRKEGLFTKVDFTRFMITFVTKQKIFLGAKEKGKDHEKDIFESSK